ncbi:MAG: hypothetical protein M3290_12850 [Actinomycetota bacterium]|nr:hypothetical protein [Actinomycetota bacterium]
MESEKGLLTVTYRVCEPPSSDICYRLVVVVYPHDTTWLRRAKRWDYVEIVGTRITHNDQIAPANGLLQPLESQWVEPQ